MLYRARTRQWQQNEEEQDPVYKEENGWVKEGKERGTVEREQKSEKQTQAHMQIQTI